MFFLPLPLEKTLKTIEEVWKTPGEGMAGLPDPELYTVVNGKPSKNKILWQSIVNVDHIKAAVLKLKEINWLYADVDNSSIDDASRRVTECVNNTCSMMIVKVTAEDVSFVQAYTIRRLDQDTEHYKLIDVKENAMNSKLKHLDVLCFPTLFPQVEGLMKNTNVQFPSHQVNMQSHAC